MKKVPEWLGDEEEGLRTIALIADEIGYGNAIAHLQREWMIRLMANKMCDFQMKLRARSAKEAEKRNSRERVRCEDDARKLRELH